jgi:hypothetical protein
MVQRVLNAQGYHNVFTPDDWKFEVLTKTIVIPKPYERLTQILTQESTGVLNPEIKG